jgi:hypothetical protein
MENVKIEIVTYNLEVTSNGFKFSVTVSKNNISSIIESIRIVSDRNVWRDLKYSIKNMITLDVRDTVNQWISENLRTSLVHWESTVS